MPLWLPYFGPLLFPDSSPEDSLSPAVVDGGQPSVLSIANKRIESPSVLLFLITCGGQFSFRPRYAVSSWAAIWPCPSCYALSASVPFHLLLSSSISSSAAQLWPLSHNNGGWWPAERAQWEVVLINFVSLSSVPEWSRWRSYCAVVVSWLDQTRRK